MPKSNKQWLECGILAIIYFVTAKLGQQFAIPPGNVTPIWLPSGIILAALFVRGYYLWPGVFFGAFSGNILAYFTAETQVSLIASLIAGTANGLGDVLCALYGAFMMTRVVNKGFLLDNTRNIGQFILHAALISSGISAFFGVTSLCATGFVPWDQYAYVFTTWLTGDCVGILILTPALVVFMQEHKKLHISLEGIIFFTLFAVVCVNTLGMITLIPDQAVLFLLPPLLIWPAFRLDRRITFFSLIIVCSVAIVGSLLAEDQSGWSHEHRANNGLIELQLFLAIQSITLLLLVALLSEKRLANEALKSLNQHLEQSVFERTSELIQSKEKLELSMVQREAAIKQLTESRKLLSEAQRISKVGSWELDLIHNKLQWSDEIYHIFEMDPETQSATYDAFLNAINPDDRELVDKAYQHSFRTGKAYEIEHSLLMADGRVKYVIERGETIYDDCHQPMSSLGTVQDITERKLAERRTRGFERIASSTEDLLALIDSNFRYITVNEAYAGAFGKTADEIIGFTVEEVFGEKMFNKVIKPHAELCLEGEDVRYEDWLMFQPPESKYMDVHYTPYIGSDNTIAGFAVSARDITDKKLVQDKFLKEVKQREEVSYTLNQFFQLPSSLHLIASFDGTITKVNQAWTTHLGYEEHELVGNSFLELVHPDDIDATLKEMEKLVEGLTTFYFENRYRHKDGSYRRMVWSANASAGDDRIYANGNDITVHRKAEQEIQESEARLRFLIDNLEAGVVIHGPDTSIILNNPKAAELLGLSSDQMMGKKAIDPEWRFLKADETFLNLEDYPVKQILNKRLPIKNMLVGIFRPATRDTVWVIFNGLPVFDQDNEIREVIISFVDISELREAERKVVKLAQAIEQSPESIIITDKEENIEYVNQAFVDTSGYNLEDVLGKNPRVLSSGKSPAENYHALSDALDKGFSWKGEFYSKRKDGTEYVEFATVSPITQVDGTISNYIAIKDDISEKKSLANELDNHRNHLERLVEERTTQLAEAKIHAESANEAKSNFLANMSHEIRTPLTAIIGLTHLARLDSFDPNQTDKLDKIDASAKHLLSTIDDVLDISKIEAGKMALEYTDFLLGNLFEQILFIVKEQATEKGLAIKVDMDGVPKLLSGDAPRLRQALLNYVANAIKFTESGYVALKTRTIEEDQDGILIRFEVEDTGIGIAPEKLEEVFRPFQQVDSSTTRKYGGAGLGLIITRRLVQMMDGECGVESEIGKGSTFWFTVRLKHGKKIEGRKVSFADKDIEDKLKKYYHGARILLVEDNDINAEVASGLLDTVGMSVTTVEDGAAAVEKVRSNEFDLVLMDIQMPRMDGLEATRLIRESKDNPLCQGSCRLIQSKNS